MKLRFESEVRVPYIEIECIEPITGKDLYYDSLKAFIDQANKCGLSIEKGCSDKYCERHWNIYPITNNSK